MAGLETVVIVGLEEGTLRLVSFSSFGRQGGEGLRVLRRRRRWVADFADETKTSMGGGLLTALAEVAEQVERGLRTKGIGQRIEVKRQCRLKIRYEGDRK